MRIEVAVHADGKHVALRVPSPLDQLGGVGNQVEYLLTRDEAFDIAADIAETAAILRADPKARPKRIEPVKEPTEPYYYEAVGKKREVTKEIAQIMLTDRILAKLNELVAAVNQMREGKDG
jgi:hypothetical protein